MCVSFTSLNFPPISITKGHVARARNVPKKQAPNTCIGWVEILQRSNGQTESHGALGLGPRPTHFFCNCNVLISKYAYIIYSIRKYICKKGMHYIYTYVRAKSVSKQKYVDYTCIFIIYTYTYMQVAANKYIYVHDIYIYMYIHIYIHIYFHLSISRRQLFGSIIFSVGTRDSGQSSCTHRLAD